jgi:hypothetical protein
MRKSKVLVLICCASASWKLFTAVAVADPNDDQERALKALRDAESKPVVIEEFPAAGATTAPAPAPAVAPVTSSRAVTTETGVRTTPITSPATEDQQKALQALRQVESAPVTSEQNAISNPAPAAPGTAAQAIEAERRAAAKAAKEKAAAARKEAREMAAAKKRNEEAARRAEELKKEMQKSTVQVPGAAPQPAPANFTLSGKEQRLADLLRRYQADEITPYEYHTLRARIIAEP